MDTLSAFAIGNASRGRTQKVFDWLKCVQLIKEHKIKNATVGLESDFEWTAGTILSNGKIVDSDYVYLASTWATPLLRDDDTFQEYPCYIMDDNNPHGWDDHTNWPEIAKKEYEKEVLSTVSD